MSLFGQHYVRTGLFTSEDGSLLSDLVIMRDNADYNLFFEANEEKITPYIEPTRQLMRQGDSCVLHKYQCQGAIIEHDPKADNNIKNISVW